MADSFVRPEKWEELRSRMIELSIYEKDLVEKFILGSGRGGQKVNKTHSCVYLKHLPTGIEIKCQGERAREVNRFLARRELCEEVEMIVRGQRSGRWLEIEKKRKQKARRKRRGSNKENTD